MFFTLPNYLYIICDALIQSDFNDKVDLICGHHVIYVALRNGTTVFFWYIATF